MKLSTYVRQWRIPALMCAFVFTSLQAAEFHVAPGGSASGNGTQSRPWDLATALAHPAAVKPGDTIWLHGGVYRGVYHSKLVGRPNAPIIVRQYPGERATIDGGSTTGEAALLVTGSDTWFWGFEVMFSNPSRFVNGSTATGFPALSGYVLVEVMGPRTKLINMVIHEGAQGVTMWVPAPDSEAYGNIVYNVGFDGFDRGHGHGFYIQNRTGKKLLQDNIVFNSFGFGLHAYTEGSYIDNITYDGNIVFNSGLLSRQTGISCNILLGGGRVAQNPVVTNNYSYHNTPYNGAGYDNLGWYAGCNNLQASGNYFVSGQFRMVKCAGTFTNNTISAYAVGINTGSYPNNTFLYNRPKDLKVVVRPNRYEAGRANIVVYNWGVLNTIPVDLSPVLKSGDAYEIRDVQNFYGPPVVSGTYSGQPVQIPIGTLHTVSAPLGKGMTTPAHTPQEFGAFVVMRTSGSPNTPPQPTPAPVNQAPNVNAGPDLVLTLPGSAALKGEVSDDGLPGGSLTTTWAKASGPGVVTFANTTGTATTATFSVAGTYVLRLSATDGELSASDTVSVTVAAAPAPRPPTTDPTVRQPGDGGSTDTSLAAHWTLDSSRNVLAKSMDSSANKLDLTWLGLPSALNGVFGEAMGLDGSSTYAVAMDDNSPTGPTQLLQDISLAVWVRTTNTSRWEGLISKYTAGPREAGYLLRLTPQGKVSMRLGGQNVASGNHLLVDSGPRVNDGKWHHITAVIRLGQNVKFYVDGKLTSTHATATTAFAALVPVNVGRNPWLDYGMYFRGALDDVRIYRKALSDSEVAALAGAGDGGSGTDDGNGTGAGSGSGGGTAADVVAPQISGITVSSITSSAVVIQWRSNEPADSQVEYGMTTSYGKKSPLSAALKTVHSVSLTGLESGKIYQYRVISADASGNVARSANLQFATAVAPSHVYIALEGEAATLSSPMAKASNLNASGGVYVQTSQRDRGAATFQLNIPVNGDYVVWARVLAINYSRDSFVVSMDGKADIYDAAEEAWVPYWKWTRVNGRAGSGTPLKVNPRKFYLSAGPHTLVFKGRELMTGLDKIIVTNDLSFAPSK